MVVISWEGGEGQGAHHLLDHLAWPPAVMEIAFDTKSNRDVEGAWEEGDMPQAVLLHLRRRRQVGVRIALLLWRLLRGTWGTWHYLANAAEHLPAAFPSWQARALGAALVLASILQWYWGWAIIRMVARKLIGGGDKKKQSTS